jgi:hypothetical protein
MLLSPLRPRQMQRANLPSVIGGAGGCLGSRLRTNQEGFVDNCLGMRGGGFRFAPCLICKRDERPAVFVADVEAPRQAVKARIIYLLHDSDLNMCHPSINRVAAGASGFFP